MDTVHRVKELLRAAAHLSHVHLRFLQRVVVTVRIIDSGQGGRGCCCSAVRDARVGDGAGVVIDAGRSCAANVGPDRLKVSVVCRATAGSRGSVHFDKSRPVEWRKREGERERGRENQSIFLRLHY